MQYGTLTELLFTTLTQYVPLQFLFKLWYHAPCKYDKKFLRTVLKSDTKFDCTITYAVCPIMPYSDFSRTVMSQAQY